MYVNISKNELGIPLWKINPMEIILNTERNNFPVCWSVIYNNKNPEVKGPGRKDMPLGWTLQQQQRWGTDYAALPIAIFPTFRIVHKGIVKVQGT